MMPRHELLAAHRQVETATNELERMFGRDSSSRDPSLVRACISRGALTDRLPVFAWRETLQDNRLDLLGALMEGAEGMTQEGRMDRARLAASYGSAAAMQMFIDQGFCPDVSLVLPDAVQADRVDVVKVLLRAGASIPVKTVRRDERLLACVQSPEMLHALAQTGARATKSDMMHAAMIGRAGPRPDLLAAFIALDTPLEDDSGPGKVWQVLLRAPDLISKHHDAFVECARLLVAAGAERQSQYPYSLPALLVALEAGMPSSEAVSGVADKWFSTGIDRRDFFSTNDPRAQMSQAELLDMIVDMLGRIEGFGVSLDLLESHGPMRPGEWAKAFALAGVEVGVEMDFDEQAQSRIDAARLRRSTQVPLRQPGVSRRL